MKSDSTTVIKNMEFLVKELHKVLLRHPLLFPLRK